MTLPGFFRVEGCREGKDVKEEILAEEAALDTLTPVALDHDRQGWASTGTPLPTPKKPPSHQPGRAVKLVSIPRCTPIRKTLAHIFRHKPAGPTPGTGEPWRSSGSPFLQGCVQNSEVLCCLRSHALGSFRNPAEAGALFPGEGHRMRSPARHVSGDTCSASVPPSASHCFSSWWSPGPAPPAPPARHPTASPPLPF